MNFKEIYYWLFNIPYYKIMVVKEMEIVGHLIQKVIEKPKKKMDGFDIAIIDIKRKKAWLKMPENCFRDGKKFIGIVDIDNAIQLVDETKVQVEGSGIIVKEMTITRLKESVVEINNDKGKMKKFVTAFPAQLMFEMLEGHFVNLSLKNPKDKPDYTFVLIAIIALIGLLVFMYSTGMIKI